MKQYAVIGIVLYLLAVVSCKKKSIGEISLPPDVAGPVVKIDSFPLKVGNKWTYKTMTQWTYLGTLQSPISGIFTITAVSDTSEFGIRFINLDTAVTGVAYFVSQFPSGYFCNLGDGVYRYGYPPSDSISIYNSYSVFLKLPVRIDSSRNTLMTWIGYEKITTPAGTFNCAKWEFGFTYNTSYFHGFQYYSNKGYTGTNISEYLVNTIILQSTNF